MKFSLGRILLPAIALAAFSGVVFAGCSSNNDNKTQDSSSSKSGTSVAASKGNGSDEEFVKGLCVAGQHFVDTIMKSMDITPAASGTATADDLGKFFESFFTGLGPAFETLAKDIKGLKPPSDLGQWHADATKQLDAAVKALKSGNFDDPAIQNLGNDALPAMPQAAQTRLEKVAASTKECQDLQKEGDSSGTGSGMFGGLIGGGN